MQPDLRNLLLTAQRDLAEAHRLFELATSLQTDVSNSVKEALKGLLNDGLGTLPVSAAPLSDHRRLHRSGATPKLESDPELQAFVVACVDRHTFTEIADAVAAHFPSERRVGRSAIWAWWSNNKRRLGR